MLVFLAEIEKLEREVWLSFHYVDTIELSNNMS